MKNKITKQLVTKWLEMLWENDKEGRFSILETFLENSIEYAMIKNNTTKEDLIIDLENMYVYEREDFFHKFIKRNDDYIERTLKDCLEEILEYLIDNEIINIKELED